MKKEEKKKFRVTVKYLSEFWDTLPKITGKQEWWREPDKELILEGTEVVEPEKCKCECHGNSNN